MNRYVLEVSTTENGNADFDMQGLIRDIRTHNIATRNVNPIVLAYVDVGQAEEWRWYYNPSWAVGSPSWIVADDPNGWEGNFVVAYWADAWQNIVIYGDGHGRSQVEETLKLGFDGIYLDWVEAFSDTSIIDRIAADGGFDEWDDAKGYNLWTDDLYPELNWTAEVLEDLQPLKGVMPIFCVEYAQDMGGEDLATQVYENLALNEGFIPYATRRSLARLSTTPYPPGYDPIDY